MGSETCSPGGEVGLELRIMRGVVVIVINCSHRHFGGVAKSMGSIDNIDWGGGPDRGACAGGLSGAGQVQVQMADDIDVNTRK